MAEKFCGKRNINFLLYEVFDVLALTGHEYFREHNRQGFDLIIEAAFRLAEKMMFPIVKDMDQHPPQLVDGQVVVHPDVKKILTAFGDGGWIAANIPYEFGGEQLPMMIVGLTHFIFSAANYSACVYPEACAGAAHLLTSFADEKLREKFLPHLLSGKWQGTMAMTEPSAGSSLGDLTTSAEPTENDWYLIQGNKVFISAGDHDGAENVVHLMLVRIKGAPAGVKGLSLFVVPNRRPDEASGRLVSNDITVSQIYHKLGYRGTPLTELAIGEHNDCRGYLVGEANKGLRYMFQMMNEARISVGLGANGIASAAYYAALEYARQRPQGRRLMERDPAQPQIPIIEHADVRRMLLFQRAVVEGALGLIVQCAQYADQEKVLTGEDKERASLLLEILTPVVKTFPAETGILSVSQGLQCLGGYGYCDDFPLEQYYRDIRIHPIHEGTTGIQGMDLLGRKVVMKEGRAMLYLGQEIAGAVARAKAAPDLKPHAESLEAAVKKMEAVILHLVGVAQEKGPEAYLADAVVFLEFFSMIVISWQWLLQALAAVAGLNGAATEGEKRFYTGKLYAFRYYFRYELPKIQALAQRLTDGDPLTLEMAPVYFND